jgi:flagellar protein FlgJ
VGLTDLEKPVYRRRTGSAVAAGPAGGQGGNRFAPVPHPDPDSPRRGGTDDAEMATGYRRILAAVLGTVMSMTVPVLTGTDRTAQAASTRKALAALTADQRAFLRTATAAARTSQRRYGLPASVVIAQTVLETGWGTSDLARTASNYFGMTCGAAGSGPVATGCRTGPDRYCDRSGCRPGTASFRTYRTMADSFADHGRHLSTNPRYSHAHTARSRPDTFVKRIALAGYATDPQYAERLTRIMKKYGLHRHNGR